jgi:hypothetical protein
VEAKPIAVRMQQASNHFFRLSVLPTYSAHYPLTFSFRKNVSHMHHITGQYRHPSKTQIVDQAKDSRQRFKANNHDYPTVIHRMAPRRACESLANRMLTKERYSHSGISQIGTDGRPQGGAISPRLGNLYSRFPLSHRSYGDGFCMPPKREQPLERSQVPHPSFICSGGASRRNGIHAHWSQTFGPGESQKAYYRHKNGLTKRSSGRRIVPNSLLERE